MHFKINFFLLLSLVYYNRYNFAKPLIGINVRTAVENEFPYVVSVMRITERVPREIQMNHRCTGTFLTRQDVLTAAHCLRNAMRAPIKILFGSIDLSQCTDYHPLFTLTYEHWALNNNIPLKYENNDIAFIKIIGNIPDEIQFALLGNAPNNALYGLDVVTAGWGKLENNTIPRILQTVTLKVITHQECNMRISDFLFDIVGIEERRLCTVGEPHALLNYGDSGGPLLFFGSIIGVNNGVCPIMDSPINPGQVNIHMSTRWYHDFISDVIYNVHINF